MSRRFALVLCTVAFAPAHVYADTHHDCNDRESTVDITQCLADTADKLDGIIDSLVGKAESGAAPDVAEAMKAAQNAWLKYRDAACLVHRLGEGSIAAIEAAECRVRLTGQRLGELRHVSE
ncbi:hypothetical protein W911_08645 [Hyphomicrobium nitrativorans NL23]|uniref:Lysozyme inhibitor LprI-like N-terminal domain-containing protein n=1 Tax=Hyphomicrobium nitrativorans NL23 TaxID=1029756 RepID=V5SJ58_9HYPH|nr:lysozyme inhibitor LprI family protein [Hyphomicrobium nitrativorans]AHB50125.1 hypothetical protein W911_08645 [Hyphomicrobium nitrativorans NL23]